MLPLGGCSDIHGADGLVLMVSIRRSCSRRAASSRVVQVRMEALLVDGSVVSRVLLHVSVGTCRIGQVSLFVSGAIIRGRRRRGL